MAQTLPVMLGRKVWSSSALDATMPGLGMDFTASEDAANSSHGFDTDLHEPGSNEMGPEDPPLEGVSIQA